MIRLPQRSVTRFFIPLIDVLTLLFCIFLIMPAVGSPEPTGDQQAARDAKVRQLEEDLERLRLDQPDLSRRLEGRLDELRRANVETLKNRLVLRVLEVDPETGELFYRDPQRVPVRSQADALRLIEQDHRDRGGAGRELYYVILCPRDPKNNYPTERQEREYERWFEGVALAFDVPGAVPKGGKLP